jgi:hypothetical protein
VGKGGYEKVCLTRRHEDAKGGAKAGAAKCNLFIVPAPPLVIAGLDPAIQIRTGRSYAAAGMDRLVEPGVDKRGWSQSGHQQRRERVHPHPGSLGCQVGLYSSMNH